jgi:hypothetical protein
MEEPMAENLRTTEEAAYALADQLTIDMLRSALQIADTVMPGDGRAHEPALIGGLVQAMAAYFSAITISRGSDEVSGSRLALWPLATARPDPPSRRCAWSAGGRRPQPAQVRRFITRSPQYHDVLAVLRSSPKCCRSRRWRSHFVLLQ